MTFTPIIAFSCIAATFAVGDYIALKTKGIISTFITAITAFILFGSVLKFFPGNMVDLSGLSSIIPTFGMTLILTNLGSTLELNELKKEWRTILVSLAGVAGIVVLGFTLGQLIFGREYALSAIAPIAGGIVATMISGDTANAAGRPDIAAYTASVMAIQILVGLPIASFCLRKSAAKYIAKGMHRANPLKSGKQLNLRLIPTTPKSLNNSTAHFARLAIAGALAQALANLTGINATICYLAVGLLASATGLIEKNSLKLAGGDGVMLLATYAYCATSFLTMTFSQFAAILLPVIGMLLIGAVGIMALSVVMGMLFKWDPFLSAAVGLACMLGYPVTYAVAMEVVNGAAADGSISETEVQNLTNQFLPKMLIAGVASVSVVSVVLAGMIAPMIFA